MYTWKNVTNYFTNNERHYKDSYLEINEVYNEEVEVSLFSRKMGPYEIYISYGCMYGIIYVEKENAESLREEVKTVLAKEYEIHKEPTDEFMKKFIETYNLSIPGDILFDDSDLFDI